MHRGEVITLLEWYKAFPADFPQRYPSLCLHFGLAFALNGRWGEAQNLLKVVEQGNDLESRPDEVLMLPPMTRKMYKQELGRLAEYVKHGAVTVS